MRNVIRKRVGFTLIELLIVMAIIGVMVALLLPIVTRSRDAARRVQCINNLRQVAIGLHNYHDAHRIFPPGCVGFPPGVHADTGYFGTPTPPTQPAFSWHVMLLPYVDQGALYNRLNPGPTTFDGALVDPQLRALLQTSVPVFNCPADFRDADPPELNDKRMMQASDGQKYALAAANYLANGGNVHGNGICFMGRGIRMNEISDGLSNTFLAGERATPEDLCAGVWGGIVESKGFGKDDVGAHAVLGHAFFQLNTGYTFVGTVPMAAFGSLHSGGACFALCDGSVRFVSESIDYQGREEEVFVLGVYNRLGKRNDGLVVGEY